MRTWIALFRGINVGGHRKLPMKELVAGLEKLGLSDVRTYIQSGNAVFRSKDADPTKLSDRIASAVEASHGFLPQVLVLSLEALQAAAAANPFPASDAAARMVHLFLLKEAPTRPDLEAMDRVPEPARLEVVGSGRQEPRLREIAGILGLLGSRVVFREPAFGDELHREYRRAACLVVPSRSPETFCYTGPEAMMHGTPVIAADAGGVEEWLEHGETGIAVPPGRPKALAAAIRDLLADPEMARALGERGRKHCQARFRPEDHVQALSGVFHGVMARRGVERGVRMEDCG